MSVSDRCRGELRDEPGIGPLCEWFGEELRRLCRRAAEQPPRHRMVAAGRRAFRLAGRYTLLLAAAACVAVWHHNPASALPAPELPDGVLDRVQGELLARHEDLRCFDLTAATLTS